MFLQPSLAAVRRPPSRPLLKHLDQPAENRRETSNPTHHPDHTARQLRMQPASPVAGEGEITRRACFAAERSRQSWARPHGWDSASAQDRSDGRNADFVLDLLEPMRPEVDRLVLNLRSVPGSGETCVK
jgi:hypothetical protein